MTIYMDHNATSPLHPKVKEAMLSVMDFPYNASATHARGRDGKALITHAKKRLSDKLGCHPDGIIFTSGATEANNQALRCCGFDAVFMPSVVHDSAYFATENAITLPIDGVGNIDLEDSYPILERARGSRAVISVLWGNNETGVIQPLEEIVGLAKKFDFFVHVDAVQMFGKVDFSFEQLGIDLLTVSAHKLGGPQGIGALIVNPRVPLSAFVRGGGQQKGQRGGTENIPAIKGFDALLDIDFPHTILRSQRDAFEQKVMQMRPDVCILGREAARLPHVSYVVTPGLENTLQLMHFDMEGVAVSRGAACSSGTMKPARVVESILKGDTLARHGVRISSGWSTTQNDYDQAYSAWEKMVCKTKFN